MNPNPNGDERRPTGLLSEQEESTWKLKIITIFLLVNCVYCVLIIGILDNLFNPFKTLFDNKIRFIKTKQINTCHFI